VELSNVLIAFGLTVFAGLSTGIGSAAAFFARRTNTKLLSVSLGFSGGVMIYVSFVELYTQANHSLNSELGETGGNWATAGAFFGGILLIALLDKLVPSFENPHEVHKLEDIDNADRASRYKKLYRMGLVTALAIGIHNFPEGLATFISALKDIKLGIPIAVAIAIHNIPEGIAVSVPIYYATGNKKKAFMYSFLSGLAEPVGALVGYLILLPFINDTVFGILFAAVAGIMVFISLDELLPAAREYGEHHLAVYGLVAGMVIMAVSLLLLG
jgi:ZIP family zinc transporter